MSRSLNTWLDGSRRHLAAAGESYWRHLRFAAKVGALMLLGGLAALVHAIVPGLFPNHASRTLAALEEGLANRSTSEAEAVIGEDALGLLTLLILSLLAAIVPWAATIDAPIAASLSLLAVGFPLAALRASVDEAETRDPVDLLLWPAAPADEHVVIVGGGFSGTMLAVRLARLGDRKVTLVERSVPAGRGVAYATSHPAHLLNVRAAKMSAFAEDPDHFARWLAERELGAGQDFAARRDYGDYLQSLLREAVATSAGGLKVVRGDVHDVRIDSGLAHVQLSDGRALTAGRVVLAVGNLPPRGLAQLDAARLSAEVYRGDPWSGPIEPPGDDGQVLLVGTGLTMIDVAVQLADSGFAGRIVAVSRRGLVPLVHGPAPAAEIVPPAAGQELSHMLRQVRRAAETHGWRCAIDALRPHTAQLWRGASGAQRARFLRHLRPWWDMHRHRIAPAVADRLAGLLAGGRLEIVPGRIVGVEPAAAGARVKVQLRGTHYRRVVDAARIINCTGADADLDGTADPLLARLIDRGHVRPDPHRLGIDIDDRGAAIGRDGAPSAVLHVVGPLARGRDWEMTAVPELRVQVEALACQLSAPAAVATVFG